MQDLLESLRIIAENLKQAIPKAHIEQLLADGYISPKYPKGWLANGKGRALLRQHRKRGKSDGDQTMTPRY